MTSTESPLTIDSPMTPSFARELDELQLDTPEDIPEHIRQKHEWVRQMRLSFCIRPEFEVTKNMIHEDGTLNQDYFRPKKGKVEARKWTSTEKDLLIQGIEKYGIGHFREISEELLPAWSGNDLRLKTIRLIGRQNLQLYKDWKGNAEAIAQEYERNKAIGLQYGMWKGGCLVYDDEGKVEAALQ
ncbi:hypothetical protein BZG36_02917 [Bifiguratus adelaidae]|uniref:Myb-like domain-containing protein n=1 Tax=Bifiguratus adelaidae TaxID=1938954 RepID=A0A261Y1C3_9FUNG|nr:hypothetical protein BZG36_02917 [Bifiguratus adelaidae]